jgi:hypothetical protein
VASEESLGEIFVVADRNNSRDGITGLLIFYEGSFFQIIEGDAEKINACFSRIEKDRRHRLPTRLSMHEVKDRAFENWEALFYLDNPDQPISVGAGNADSKVRLRDLLNAAEGNTLSDDPALNVFVKNFLFPFRELQ